MVFLAAAPILCVYPFLQKYFMKGLVMGSVKG
jgi:putative aldouronate transport system permease protein